MARLTTKRLPQATPDVRTGIRTPPSARPSKAADHRRATPTGDAAPRLLREITPRNILSFDSRTKPIPLRGLNVLIGPNGSGKSNLLDLVALLRAAPDDLRAAVRQGGGVAEWVWKGNPGAAASLDVVVDRKGRQPLRHVIAFRASNQVFRLEEERIENAAPYEVGRPPHLLYDYRNGRPVLDVRGEQRPLAPESIDLDLSILAQRRDPESYPEISYLADAYKGIRVYREWTFGSGAVLRIPQKTDLRSDQLEEDCSNLGMFLNRLSRKPRTKQAIMQALRKLYEGLDDFGFQIEGGTVQVFFVEGDFTIPATRLSDGTLRYLALVAILCDPDPPHLIGIEEPELGLHPDLLPTVADLCIAAAERTQLIVTTHSDILVDAMTDWPEVVVVCEKDHGATEMRRLDGHELTGWLDRYRLGELWTSGELGGTRW